MNEQTQQLTTTSKPKEGAFRDEAKDADMNTKTTGKESDDAGESCLAGSSSDTDLGPPKQHPNVEDTKANSGEESQQYQLPTKKHCLSNQVT